MVTIVDETRTFSDCPWCHAPGKLMARQTALYGIFAYSIGCVSPYCKVKPRTNETRANKVDIESAVQRCMEYWESR